MDQWLKVLVVEDEDVLRKGLILTTAWDRINAKVIGKRIMEAMAMLCSSLAARPHRNRYRHARDGWA